MDREVFVRWSLRRNLWVVRIGLGFGLRDHRRWWWILLRVTFLHHIHLRKVVLHDLRLAAVHPIHGIRKFRNGRVLLQSSILVVSEMVDPRSRHNVTSKI
jgi:hypothetical protein